LKVGVDPAFYPVQSGPKDAYVFAFFNELLEEIAQLKKIRIERVNRSWDNLIEGLNRHDYDVVFSSLEPRIYNEEIYSFSNLILSTGPVILVPIGSTIKSLEELENHIVGVEEYSVAAMQISRDPSVSLSFYQSYPEAIEGLLAGNYEAVVMDSIIANAYIKDLFPGQVKVLQQPLIDQGIRAISLYKTKNHEIKLMNEAIDELKAKGSFAALLKKWNLSLDS
jgi:polar amino acid transport system substrate-binding protein